MSKQQKAELVAKIMGRPCQAIKTPGANARVHAEVEGEKSTAFVFLTVAFSSYLI